jgi:spectinomycin phosphotransferase
MKEAPPGFPEHRLAEVLQDSWQISASTLEYLPVGFGAHHWRASTRDQEAFFLALHDLGSGSADQFHRLRQPLETAAWLQRTIPLEFVVGPLADVVGNRVRRFSNTFALVVYPLLNCRPVATPDRDELGRFLDRLHAITPRLPTSLLGTEDFRIPWRAQLESVLLDLDSRWDSGPYGEAARDRLRLHSSSIRALLAFYDRAATEALALRQEWVISHGEPYGPNLVETDTGRLLLVDWDSALLAPRERDLWEMPCPGMALSTYQTQNGAALSEDRLQLYRAWYHLAETAIYTHDFRAPHRGDLNDATRWENFIRYLPSLADWPDVVPLRQH